MIEYIYLEQRIELGKSGKKEKIKRRIRTGWVAFGWLRDNKITQLKTKVFEQRILPTMTY